MNEHEAGTPVFLGLPHGIFDQLLHLGHYIVVPHAQVTSSKMQVYFIVRSQIEASTI